MISYEDTHIQKRAWDFINTGNEEANALAKRSAQMSVIGPEPFCGMGECTYKWQFLEKGKAERKKLWRNLPGIDHTIEFLRNFETARSIQKIFGSW